MNINWNPDDRQTDRRPFSFFVFLVVEFGVLFVVLCVLLPSFLSLVELSSFIFFVFYGMLSFFSPFALSFGNLVFSLKGGFRLRKNKVVNKFVGFIFEKMRKFLFVFCKFLCEHGCEKMRKRCEISRKYFLQKLFSRNFAKKNFAKILNVAAATITCAKKLVIFSALRT